MSDAVVIGAGPAGLMAAEMMGQAGVSVTLVDAMPSVGRKFLMAGKSGLNLTKSEPIEPFFTAFNGANRAMVEALQQFGPEQVMAWAEGLGQPLFTGSTGRVFPRVMKASPLLRAWIARLVASNVDLRTRWRWKGWKDDMLCFDTPQGMQNLRPKATVLALGGASWARLGSDGAWAQYFPNEINDFRPSNMGITIEWSDHMSRHFGQPLKSVALHCGGRLSRGEVVISQRGIEGGGIYSLSKPLREGERLTIDLRPDWPIERLRAALAKRGKQSLSNHLRKSLKLSPIHVGLLSEFGRPFSDDLAPLIKSLPIRHAGPRPLDEAISTAGGLRLEALNDQFMLRTRPGVFCAGEMLDWEAPTGGYLITGCLATGRAAGLAAAAYAAVE